MERVPTKEVPCSKEDIIAFITRIFNRMQLAIECVLIHLIYLERIMQQGNVEIRYCNWRPMVFTAILLASKFWEDINFWNVDFVEVIKLYSLRGINTLESEFLGLCQYNLFVSASLYAKYYFAVRHSDLDKPKNTAKAFDRFKQKREVGVPPQIDSRTPLLQAEKDLS